MMNILVTGGAGYVGSVLVPYLLKGGHRVRVLDSLAQGGRSMLGFWSDDQFEFVRGDVRDEDVVRRAVEGVDAVVHLAAIVGDPACARDPELARSVNVDGSTLVLAESERAGVKRFVFASTCSNYGRMSDPNAYVDESSELSPVSLYAETKVTVERMVMGPRESALTATALRFATVYGVSPRMRFDLTVNEFTMEMITKKHLVVFGEYFWRPYIHVHDMARGVVLTLEAPTGTVAGEVFNVGSTKENYQKRQIVDMIRPYATDANVETVSKQEDPRDYRVSFSKIESVLKFTPTRRVADGIREIAQLVRDGVIVNFNEADWRN